MSLPAEAKRGCAIRRRQVVAGAGSRDADGNGTKAAELTQLRAEGAAKVLAVRRVQRAIAETVVGVLEDNHTALTGLPAGPVLSAASTASKPELAEKSFSRPDRPASDPVLHLRLQVAHRSNVIRLARRELSLQFVRMHVAHRMEQFRQSAAVRPATRGLAWPAAATPKAAVRSRYSRRSASQRAPLLRAPRRWATSRPVRRKVTLRDS